MDSWDQMLTKFEKMFGKAEYLTCSEFCEWGRISRKTIDRMIQDGRLSVGLITKSGERRFSKNEALDFYITGD